MISYLFSLVFFQHLISSFFLLILIFSSLYGEEKKEDLEKIKDKIPSKEVEPPRIGNFSLATSQQPAALFGFGGNIIDRNEVQLYFFADKFKGKSKEVVDLIPGILFGVTENLTFFFNFPFTPLMKEKKHHSKGLEDSFIQLEYGFYSKKNLYYEDQATVVSAISVPTGSTKKNPLTGFGSPTLFLGATYYRTLVNWVFFTEHGALLTSSDHGTKIGDQFFYQYGISRVLSTPSGYIFAAMIELNGQYFKKNRIERQLDPHSGGNFIYLTPSLWISSKNFLLQLGPSFPISQNLFGNQTKFDYAFNLNCAWSFY